MNDLELDRLLVVYPGTRRYPLAEGVEALPLQELISVPTDNPPSTQKPPNTRDADNGF